MDALNSLLGAGFLGGTLFVVTLVSVGVVLIPFIFWLVSMQKALRRCSPESRKMSPGLVWLMLIPAFNYVWIYFVVIQVSNSVKAEFEKRGIKQTPPSLGLGVTLCIFVSSIVIPFVGWFVSVPVAIILGIVYWVQVASRSKLLA